MVVDNPGEKLKKDMYCTVTVTAGSVANAVAVPDAAVLRDDENEPFVYVVTGSNQFGRRSVGIGQSQNGQTQILKGLSVGEKVVGQRRAVSAVRQFVPALMATDNAQHDPSHRPIRSTPALSGLNYGCTHGHSRRDFVPAHARRRLPRSFSAHGGDNHAVARPRRRRGGAAGHASHRSGNERHAED